MFVNWQFARLRTKRKFNLSDIVHFDTELVILISDSNQDVQESRVRGAVLK